MARVLQVAPIWIQKQMQMKKITYFGGSLRHRHRQRCRNVTTTAVGTKPTKINDENIRGDHEVQRINAQIRAFCAEGRLKEALENLHTMNRITLEDMHFMGMAAKPWECIIRCDSLV